MLEPLSGYLTLGAYLAGEAGENYCKPYNFGPRPESAKSVFDLVTTIGDMDGVELRHNMSSTEGPHEAQYLKLAIDRAVEELGWCPVWDYETTLRHTWEGYKEIYANPGQSKALVEEEIASYSRDASRLGLSWA